MGTAYLFDAQLTFELSNLGSEEFLHGSKDAIGTKCLLKCILVYASSTPHSVPDSRVVQLFPLERFQFDARYCSFLFHVSHSKST